MWRALPVSSLVLAKLAKLAKLPALATVPRLAAVTTLSALLAGCGGSSVSNLRAHGREGCSVEIVGPRHDVTFVRDRSHAYGFSLPPPAAWRVECVEDDDRLLRAEHETEDASVSVTVDATPSEESEVAYLRRFMREVRAILGRRGMQLTQPRIETIDEAPIGVMEIRTRDGGETSLHVAAFTVIQTNSGSWLRLMVSLPSTGRYGHGDEDPIVRRAIATASSFGLTD